MSLTSLPVGFGTLPRPLLLHPPDLLLQFGNPPLVDMNQLVKLSSTLSYIIDHLLHFHEFLLSFMLMLVIKFKQFLYFSVVETVKLSTF